jgi:serine/threonine-protein kinase
VIHRDIKPSNLFLARLPDGREIVKVLDFGIAKAAPGDDLGSLTTSLQALGSPQFISPEQIRNPKRVDARTDLWSLGAVMYRLLAGRYPFNGPSAMAIQAAIAAAQRPALLDVAPGVPRELAEIVERCLRVDPDARYASAAELGEALRPHIGGVTSDPVAPRVPVPKEAVTEERTTVVVPPKPPARSARRWVVLGVGFALAVVGASALRAVRAPPPSTPAEAPLAASALPSAPPMAAPLPVPEAPSATEEAPRAPKARAHRPVAPPPSPVLPTAPVATSAPPPVPPPPAPSSSGPLRSNPYR